MKNKVLYLGPLKTLNKRFKMGTIGSEELGLKNEYILIGREQARYSKYNELHVVEQMFSELKNVIHNKQFEVAAIYNTEKDEAWFKYREFYRNLNFDILNKSYILPIMKVMLRGEIPIKFHSISYKKLLKVKGSGDCYTFNDAQEITIKGDLSKPKVNSFIGSYFTVSEKSGRSINTFPRTSLDKSKAFHLQGLWFKYKGYMFKLSSNFDRINTNAPREVVEDLMLNTEFTAYIDVVETKEEIQKEA